ncbi:MAG: GIY-YIG nuclease family protein [Patescibacteria group bacterium]|jgi:predicted GIY-YIG superfamily endonuclease
MFFVYIIQSMIDRDQFYTGFTDDIENRITKHNKGDSFHTKKYRPWKLLFYSAFEEKKKALCFEKYLKTGSGIAYKRKHFI